VEPTVQVFWVPKQGNSPDEYEDAYSCAAEEGRFAIADGATESSFAEIWAQVLVRQFSTTPPNGSPPTSRTLIDWLDPLQKEWHANINWQHLPWYAEEKAKMGAYATLLGLKFQINKETKSPSLMDKMFSVFKKPEPPKTNWEALAVGDSNLFQVRDNSLLRAFPMEKAEDFNSRPMLLSSNPDNNKPLWAHVAFLQADCYEQDIFILATDALSKWILERHEAGTRPWNTLTAIKTDAEFEKFVNDLRKNTQLRNDDTTLMVFAWSQNLK